MRVRVYFVAETLVVN